MPAPAPAPALLVQAASRVNATTAGEQIFRSIGAVTGGGYTVAWISVRTLFIQRYDSAGNKVGAETATPFMVRPCANTCPPSDTAEAIAEASVAVLNDGGAVVAYPTARTLSGSADAPPVVGRLAINIQRFDANGAQVLPETEVAGMDVRFDVIDRRFEIPQVTALSDGGFVVGWADSIADSLFGTKSEHLFHQRYDSLAQRVGGVVTENAASGILSFSLLPDSHGGYTVYALGLDLDATFASVLSVTHYDAREAATPILVKSPSPTLHPPMPALLVPLAQGYVFFTRNTTSAFRQFLDSAGKPVGEQTSVSSVPVAATELADGSYVVFSQDSGGASTAQHFDATGAALGDAVRLDALVSAQGVAALPDRSLALAWSMTPAGGDTDVFTQRVLVQP